MAWYDEYKIKTPNTGGGEITKNAVSGTVDTGMSILSGAGKGASMVMSLPETLTNLGSKGITFLGKKAGLLDESVQAPNINIPLIPSYEEAEAMRMKDPILGYIPQTDKGKFASVVTENTIGGGAFGRIPAVIGSIGGTVQGAYEKFINKKEGSGTLPNLLTQVTLGIATGFKNPAHIKALKDAYKLAKEQGVLDKARELQETAKKYGINLTSQESLVASGSSALDDVTQKSINSTSGSSVFSKFFNNRTDELNDASKKFLDDFFGGDAQLVPKDVTNKYVQTIQKAVDDTRTKINKKARELGYDKFDSIKLYKDVVDNVVFSLKGLSYSPANKAQQGVFNKYIKKIQGGNQSNLQKVSSEMGDEIKRLKLDGQYTQARTLTIMKKIVDNSLNQFEGYTKASRFYQKAKNIIANPLEDALTSGKQIKVGTDGSMGLIRKVLMNENVSPVEIKRLANVLKKYDKEGQSLFTEMSQLLVERQIGKISNTGNYAKDFYKSFYGNANTQKNMEAIIEAIAISEGKNPKRAIQGFRDFMNIMKGASSTPAKGSQTTPLSNFDKDMSSTMQGVDLARPSTYPVVKNFLEYFKNRRYGELAGAITGSIDDFILMAKSPSRRFKENMTFSIFNPNLSKLGVEENGN